MCVCVCSPDLSRSQNKVLESLEFIPQHEEPVTTTNYDSIRRYLIKVQVATCEVLFVSIKMCVSSKKDVTASKLLRPAIEELH